MGPLHGIKIVELAGIGPGPMTAMLLADLGATVIRVDRAVSGGALGIERPLEFNLLLRNRESIKVDLKSTVGRDLVLRLIEDADGLIEGFRPGVMERLGLGPDVCQERNPRLVYGRMTGWGQTGPLAQVVGHDLNYIALTGVLAATGREGQPPTPPLNLVGDFGGGALYLALGMLAAMLEARASGLGQVVDAAIVDGVASLATSLFGMHAAGMWTDARGSNILDSGAYYYETYQCLDGKWISVAPIEKKFHDELLRLLDIDPQAIGNQTDPTSWPEGKKLLAERFKTKTRDEWSALLGHLDVCFAPVLSLDEAAQHPHLQARETLIDVDGVMQPAPAPRFSRTTPEKPRPPKMPDVQNNLEALAGWLPGEEIKEWSKRLTA